MHRIRLQEYVHAEFGEIRVHWRQEPGFALEVPYAYEAGLFCPDSEVDHLRKWMEEVRVDRAISVSASDHPENL